MTSPKHILQPQHLFIDRAPTWPSQPREVGDGMEAERSYKIIRNVTEQDHVPRFFSSQGTSHLPTPLLPTYYAINKDSAVTTEDVAVQVNESLSDQICIESERFLNEEKAALKDHLQIQIQVNQELKKLLVASVGDELSYHFDRLATENAQLLMEIDGWKKKYDEKVEELERVEISCDVWRSKFLASRMQCEDVAVWKRIQERHQHEMESAIRGLLREHWESAGHLEHLHKTLSTVSGALRCGRKNNESFLHFSNKEVAADPTIAAEGCRELANIISEHLLGKAPPPRPSGSPRHPACITANPTPAERYVLQLLSEQRHQATPHTNLSSPSYGAVQDRKHPPPHTINRFHSHAVFDNITINCCQHCKGEIHVV